MFVKSAAAQAIVALLALGHGVRASPVETRTAEGIHERAAGDFFLRVLPLGASVTYGTGSSDGNGYRKYIRDQLRWKGWDVNMVGSLRSGTMADKDNEGHGGYVISQVTTAAQTAVPAYHPNVVLLNAGINDCIQNIDTANAGTRLKAAIDYIFGALPSVTVIMSTLQPLVDDARRNCTTNLSAQFRTLATTYSGARLALADINSFLTVSDIGGDGIHPTDAGYKKIAAVWWDAISQVADQIQAPDSTIDDAAQTGPNGTGGDDGPIVDPGLPPYPA